MRSGDPGFEVSPDGRGSTWNIRRAPGQAWPKTGWGTDFSCFRMGIPEMAGFRGKHIYLDADMLVRGDIAELWSLTPRRPFLAKRDGRTDVSLIDAEMARQCSWWPKLEQIRKSGWNLGLWVRTLMAHDAIDPSLPCEWNVCDPHNFMHKQDDPGCGQAKLLHYTTVPTQPWRPYQSVPYHAHPWPSWVEEWNAYRQETLHAASA